MDFTGIFETATNIGNPLAYAGLIAAVLFFVVRQILAKNMFPKLTAQLSSDLIKLVIRMMFILAIVSIVLGFGGFIFTQMSEGGMLQDQLPGSTTKVINGTVLLEGKGLPGVNWMVQELEKSDQTNRYGRFKLEFDERNAVESYSIQLSHEDINDTVIVFPDTANLTNLKLAVTRSKARKRPVQQGGGGTTLPQAAQHKPAAEPITLRGMVLDADNNRLEGVTVSTRDGETAVTNALGVFNIPLNKTLAELPSSKLYLDYVKDGKTGTKLVRAEDPNIKLVLQP